VSIFNGLFAKRARSPGLDEQQNAAVARWRACQASDLSGPLADQRWLVVDVETTGLDVRRDRLLAIGAVLVEGATIRLDQSFEVVIRQATPSRADNILIHRIAGSEQLQGIDAIEALVAFLEYAQKLPCVAFHAAFDESMLKRAFEEQLGIQFAPEFIDLALLAPALITSAPVTLRSLDDWVAHFSIRISARHCAVADAVGTAQLFQVLLSRAATLHVESAMVLFRLARDQRRLEQLSPN